VLNHQRCLRMRLRWLRYFSWLIIRNGTTKYKTLDVVYENQCYFDPIRTIHSLYKWEHPDGWYTFFESPGLTPFFVSCCLIFYYVINWFCFVYLDCDVSTVPSIDILSCYICILFIRILVCLTVNIISLKIF